MTRSSQPGNGVPADIRTDIAHPARVYDYWLGGKDNFAADRAAAEQVLNVIMPEILDTARGPGSSWCARSASCRDAEDPPVHRHRQRAAEQPERSEIAQAGDTGARVVYVDNDPWCSCTPRR